MNALRAVGISVHTGWGACVVVTGSLARSVILANERVQVLGDDERFCFHMAADMNRPEAEAFLVRIRSKALANARRALAPLVAGAKVCAIVAKPGDAGALDEILAAHPRMHSAEGCLYRDVFSAACGIPVTIVPPGLLDDGQVGRLAPPPWGKDQRLAALAA